MKKLFLAAIAVFTFQFSQAQIEEGDSMINLGVGISPTFYSGTGFESSLLPIEGSFEYMLKEKISIGAFVGFSTAEFRAQGFNFGYDYTYLLAGALGNYHFSNSEKFDAYVGLKLGYVNISADEVGTAGIGFSADSSGVLYGGQLGARYWISDAIGINAEVGYGISIVRAGITFKL